ncbi:MAG: hypothetical protein IJQ69_03600 [Bacteroidales bacterium]|nr:hypothetical protein [Bacteroidales bacterium]
MNKKISQEATLYLILSSLLLMVAQALGVVPFVLSMVYFIKSQSDEADRNPQEMRRLRVWIIITLVLSFVLCIATVTYLVTTLTEYLRQR